MMTEDDGARQRADGMANPCGSLITEVDEQS